MVRQGTDEGSSQCGIPALCADNTWPEIRMGDEKMNGRKHANTAWPGCAFILVCLAAMAGYAQAGKNAGDLSAAHALLEKNGISIRDKYRISRFVPYSNGGGMIWVDPIYRGVPVFQHERAFHFNKGGTVKRDRRGNILIGGAEPLDVANMDIDVTPQISEQEAKQIFSKRAETIRLPHMTGDPAKAALIKGPECAAEPGTLQAELGIFDLDATGRHQAGFRGVLAWRVACNKGSPHAFIGARNGSVLYFDSGIRS